MSSNEQQIQYWNDEAGPKWVQLQERLDGQIGPIGEALLDRVDPKPGERVIDVGCGCGATTLSIAQRIAPGGHVTGLDISGPMLARAKDRAAQAGLTNVEFVQGDAQVAKLPAGEADLVTSRFGVMFFEDSVAAFSNLRSALRPGGRLGFACWQPINLNPWMLVPATAAFPLLPEPPPPPDPMAPGPFAFGDADRVRQILSDAGFANVELENQVGKLLVGGDGPFDETVDFVLRIGPLSRVLGDADADLIARIKVAVAEALEPHRTDAGISMQYAVWLVGATNP